MFEKYTLKDINRVIASDSMRETIKETLQPEEPFMCFNYTNYGGSFADKVIIEWAKKYYPDNIISEDTSWSGSNAVIFGEPLEYLHGDWYYTNNQLEDMYDDMQRERVKEALDEICEDITFENSDEGIIKMALEDALNHCGHPEPNYYDYDFYAVLYTAQDYIDDWGYNVELNKYFKK